MTEDDTFNILRRIPFNDLQILIRNMPDNFNHNITEDFSEYEIQFLKNYGWTLLAFVKNWKEFKANEVEKPEDRYNWWPDVLQRITDLENGKEY